jgi:hypothetical protein
MELKVQTNYEGRWVGMSRLFVPKNAIVRIEQMNEGFELEDQYGKYPGIATDCICTREEDKSKFILPDDYVKEHYIEVEKVNQPERKFTHSEAAQGYAEMGNLRQEEDWSYIKRDTKELNSNKPC